MFVSMYICFYNMFYSFDFYVLLCFYLCFKFFFIMVLVLFYYCINGVLVFVVLVFYVLIFLGFSSYFESKMLGLLVGMVGVMMKCFVSGVVIFVLDFIDFIKFMSKYFWNLDSFLMIFSFVFWLIVIVIFFGFGGNVSCCTMFCIFILFILCLVIGESNMMFVNFNFCFVNSTINVPTSCVSYVFCFFVIVIIIFIFVVISFGGFINFFCYIFFDEEGKFFWLFGIFKKFIYNLFNFEVGKEFGFDVMVLILEYYVFCFFLVCLFVIFFSMMFVFNLFSSLFCVFIFYIYIGLMIVFMVFDKFYFIMFGFLFGFVIDFFMSCIEFGFEFSGSMIEFNFFSKDISFFCSVMFFSFEFYFFYVVLVLFLVFCFLLFFLLKMMFGFFIDKVFKSKG